MLARHGVDLMVFDGDLFLREKHPNPAGIGEGFEVVKFHDGLLGK